MYGLDYKVNERLTAQYHYAELEDIYRQQFVGLLANQPVGQGVLSADVRLLKSDDAGSAKASTIDNRALGAMLGYSLGGHKVSAGWQRMNGDTSMPYLDGSNPYLVNYLQVNDFANAQERSWQLRHDLDFAVLGVPGLTMMNRYISGDNIHTGAITDGKEWGRESELAYTVQSGTFKDLNMRWRNASIRRDYSANEFDENRLIVSYPLNIL